jgi:hypothetical protein
MSLMFTPPSRSALEPASILLAAVRCWRRARDTGRAAQPALYAELSPQGLGMLTPVLDGLFAAFDATYDCRFEIAADAESRLSPDERALLDCLDGGSVNGADHSPLGDTLEIALRSVRITTDLEDVLTYQPSSFVAMARP